MNSSHKRRRRRQNQISKLPRVKGDEHYVYLTVDQNESSPGHSSMCITYHIDKGKEQAIYYRPTKSNGDWKIKKVDVIEFQNEPNISICHAHLYGLLPNTEYSFFVGDVNDRRVFYRFITLPDSLDNGNVFGAYSSDFHQGSLTLWSDLLKVVGSYNCRFLVITGDWVDDFNLIENSHLWKNFWKQVAPLIKDKDGRLIPMLPGVGNHDVAYYLGNSNMPRPFFVDMFGFPEYSKGVVDFGDYLSIVMMDTETPWELNGNPYNFDDQTVWLGEVLSERTNQTFVTPTYHRPKYPSSRGQVSYDDWVKLFDQHSNVRACFEAHDHTYKQTHPLKNNTIDENGIIYFGDGGLSAKYYNGDYAGEWYMDSVTIKTANVRVVEFSKTKMTVRGYNRQGQVLSTTEIPII